jgi:ribosomal protein S18 acetylase RimI-like enzyme
LVLARIATAYSVDPAELAAVAARTFPLACPPSVTVSDIAAFVDANLSAVCFADYLTDPQRLIFTTSHGGRITGYAMLITGDPDDPDVRRAIDSRPATELSKMYVLPAQHGSGAAAALMHAALTASAERDDACVWLGVNQKNERAQQFYKKSGFTIGGSRRFRLGRHLESDYVMVRPVMR